MRKSVFWSVFVVTLLLLSFGASRIKLEEDITKFFPDDERVERLNYVFQNSKFVERMVIMVSASDSVQVEPDSLIVLAEELADRISLDLKPYVKKITRRVEEERIGEFIDVVQEYLPVFLHESDYVRLDSITNPEAAKRVLRENYAQLISPSGIALKKVLVKDPLGIAFLAISKLQQLQYDEGFELYDGYILTKDRRNLIFFVQPTYPPSETGNNSIFVEGLDAIVEGTAGRHAQAKASYFGAAAVAVGNANQLRRDTTLTVSLMVILLAVFLIGFFRKKRVILLILVPVIFGGVFSLCCIYLMKGSVSILAIAAGSVVLGIAVNYSLHFLVHLKHTHDIRHVIGDLVGPLTLGSATTVLAFFCLQFVNAKVLRDLGLFAGFSLIGAALCSLIFLPHLIAQEMFLKDARRENWIERINFLSPSFGKFVVWGILLVTPVFFFFARQVTFNSDMSKLNFMSEETFAAQRRLESINKSSLSSVYVVSTGQNLEMALRKTEQVTPFLQRLKESNDITRYSTVSTFMISDSLQRVRLEKWSSFWTAERKSVVISAVRGEGKALGFSNQVLDNFEKLVSRRYETVNTNSMNLIRTAFFDDYIIERDTLVTVISLANVDPSRKSALYLALESAPVKSFDRQMLTNLFVEYINADFSFIVTFTAILVFVALFISYGRIELTIITFTPMFITWIWILGIMGFMGIEFNIVNVMVSTFIFGLGDDYSIFIMDGLQQEYRIGKKNLPAIRSSIFLSAVTTIAGLGVLIFAQHPALRSIASIAIIGIVCVLIMSQTIEPFLFRALICHRTRKGFAPMTWGGILWTFLTYFFFVTGAIAMTIVGLVFKVIPFYKEQVRLFYHRLIRIATWTVIYMDPNVKKRILGKTTLTFSSPSVFIANHTSFLDILLTAMLHPKIILLTNKWVWKSPIFGGVARLADYYPITDGADEGVTHVSERVKEGYSIIVFPEGKRSVDGKPGRFHKGAFYLAEALKLPIQPLLIHGAGDAIPKGTFYLNRGMLTLKFLPLIEVKNTRFGSAYAERTKAISRYFKQEYNVLASETETPEYFRNRLISNYLYKGPVLEWYMRIKLRLENNYDVFHKLAPTQGTILDLGCGYGFLCYMLQLLSADRIVSGVDYDEQKIETANHGYLKTEKLQFFCADVTQFPLEKYDAIILSDVLHYLKATDQELLLKRCFGALNAGGKLIIREGNADMKERHKGTQLTEFFSVKLLKFNKSVNPLNFVSGENIKALAMNNGMRVTILDDAKFTSNVIFVVE
jgi:1-acyl-sn-glycerol-3-phosphate acyltransferase